METRASGGVPFVVNENIYILFCVQLAKSLKTEGDRMPTIKAVPKFDALVRRPP